MQFLSGMKEDLNMYGNQLVTAVSIWTVGYVLVSHTRSRHRADPAQGQVRRVSSTLEPS